MRAICGAALRLGLTARRLSVRSDAARLSVSGQSVVGLFSQPAEPQRAPSDGSYGRLQYADVPPAAAQHVATDDGGTDVQPRSAADRATERRSIYF